MSEVALDAIKVDLDGGRSYRCNLYVNKHLTPDTPQHWTFSFIVEVLDWVEEMRAQYPNDEVGAYFHGRTNATTSTIEEALERWEKIDAPEGEHPVDTEWRGTLADMNPGKKKPNKVKQRRRRKRGEGRSL